MTDEGPEVCSLCGQRAHVVVESAPGYVEDRTYMIYECDGCRASFAFPLKSDDAIYSLIYSNIQAVPGYNRYYRYAHEVLNWNRPLDYLSLQEESYWAVARHMRERRVREERLNILEVGCGMGYFTYALAKDGFRVTGVDISSQAIDWARMHYGPYYEIASLRDLASRGLRYDAIIMNELLEHLSDVGGFVKEARALLSAGGEIILTTPNKSAFPEENWESDLPPVHLWWLAEESIRYLALTNDCSVSFIDFEQFYRSFFRPKLEVAPIADRNPTFNADGMLLVSDEVSTVSHFRRIVEKTGGLKVLHWVKTVLTSNNRWSGARGPITAAVLRSEA